MSVAEQVWEGAEALRSFLVAADKLEPFPSNPRRGDVAAVRESLRRFGQVRPVLVADDGQRIVAGHHVVAAARELGWTHVAAVPNEFGSEDEARAYLLADNRTHDRGDYDLDQLLEQLRIVQETEVGLLGTGYAQDDVAYLVRQIEDLERAAAPPLQFPPLDPGLLEVEHRCPSCGYEWSGQAAPGAGGE